MGIRKSIPLLWNVCIKNWLLNHLQHYFRTKQPATHLLEGLQLKMLQSVDRKPTKLLAKSKHLYFLGLLKECLKYYASVVTELE